MNLLERVPQMCSLKEAFEPFESQGDTPLYSTNIVDDTRKKKRRRRLLPPETIDPDRPALRRPPPAEELGNLTESFDASLLTASNNDNGDSYFPHPSNDADDKNIYRLEADWGKVFDNTTTSEWIPPTNISSPLTPSPWIDGSSTLWKSIPGTMHKDVGSESRLDDLLRRMDRVDSLFADLEMSRSQSNHLEILMFVLAGLFLILLLDLLVKQGTHVTLAMAGGASYILNKNKIIK